MLKLTGLESTLKIAVVKRSTCIDFGRFLLWILTKTSSCLFGFSGCLLMLSIRLDKVYHLIPRNHLICVSWWGTYMIFNQIYHKSFFHLFSRNLFLLFFTKTIQSLQVWKWDIFSWVQESNICLCLLKTQETGRSPGYGNGTPPRILMVSWSV